MYTILLALLWETSRISSQCLQVEKTTKNYVVDLADIPIDIYFVCGKRADCPYTVSLNSSSKVWNIDDEPRKFRKAVFEEQSPLSSFLKTNQLVKLERGYYNSLSGTVMLPSGILCNYDRYFCYDTFNRTYAFWNIDCHNSTWIYSGETEVWSVNKNPLLKYIVIEDRGRYSALQLVEKIKLSCTTGNAWRTDQLQVLARQGQAEKFLNRTLMKRYLTEIKADSFCEAGQDSPELVFYLVVIISLLLLLACFWNIFTNCVTSRYEDAVVRLPAALRCLSQNWTHAYLNHRMLKTRTGCRYSSLVDIPLKEPTGNNNSSQEKINVTVENELYG